MQKKIGICINYGGCDHARAKEKQEVEATNFVCEKCGKPLREVAVGPTGPNWGLIGGIAAAVAVLGVGAYFAFFGNGGGAELCGLELNKKSLKSVVGMVDTLQVSNNPADAPATYVWSSDNNNVATVKEGIVTMVGEGNVTITVKAQENDTIAAACTYTVVSKVDGGGGGGGGTGTGTGTGDSAYNLGWATYDGPVSGGKPHGMGGTLLIKKNYSINLKDGNGGMQEVSPGDKIVGTKFSNGALIQGELHRSNGDRKMILIG